MNFFILSIKCGDTFRFSGLNLVCNSINSEEISVDVVKKNLIKLLYILGRKPTVKPNNIQ